jgi:hypothetical protein
MRTLVLAATMALGACSQGSTEADEAEFAGVPPEQAAQIREAGPVIDPASYGIFAGLVDARRRSWTSTPRTRPMRTRAARSCFTSMAAASPVATSKATTTRKAPPHGRRATAWSAST